MGRLVAEGSFDPFEYLRVINAYDTYRDAPKGDGVRIGIVDSGASKEQLTLMDRLNWPSYANLVDAGSNDLANSDVIGHGTLVAQAAVARPRGQFVGGLAPEAQLDVLRIIPDVPRAGMLFGQPDLNTALEKLEYGLRSSNNEVRALGFSWTGNFSWTDQGLTDRLVGAFRSYINYPSSGDYRYSDGLLVFAAGDGGRSNPEQLASLPSQPGGSILEANWITVAAVETDHPDRLASYSNACGVAMNYCMVAPGDVIVTGMDDADFRMTFLKVSSSQMAAPQVLGAAAAVMSAFPYMEGEMVRHVLLGTAKDLGEAGVDPVFGHGLLDLGKALRGPAKFDWGDVMVDIAESHPQSHWSNDISGSGGLVKRGDGVLFLEGNNTYTGDTRVEGGSLLVSGSITSNVSITKPSSGNAARFMILPDGLVKGNVDNQGIFAGSSSRGATTVDGNYVQHAGATFSIWLGADALDVTGTATLMGGDVRAMGAVRLYLMQSRQVLINAAQGLTGRFDGIVVNPGLLLESTFGYDANSVWLDITRAQVTVVTASMADITPAAMGGAVRVESAFDEIDAGKDVPKDFIHTAGEIQRIDSGVALASTLRSLSGEVHAAAAAATYDTLDLGRRALSSRFDDLSSGSHRAGGWMEALGGTASLGSGVDAQVNGWLAGHDMALDGAMVAGLAFGESRTDSRINGLADRSRERQTQAQAYMGRHWSQGYVMGQFGAGQWQRQIDRELLLGASTYGVHSDYDGDFAVAGLEAGYRFEGAAGSLVPYVGTEHMQVRSDGFHEQGAAGFGLRTGDSTSSRTQAIAGLRASRDWQRFSVSGYAEWQQTLSSDGLELSASFVGVDSWSPLAASNPALSGCMVGLQATAWLGTSSTLALGVDQRFGPRGDASLVSVKYAFGF